MSQEKKVYQLTVTQTIVTRVDVLATAEEVKALDRADGPNIHWEVVDKWGETETDWEITEQTNKDDSSISHNLDWFMSPSEVG
jgi:hypothetical protein